MLRHKYYQAIFGYVTDEGLVHTHLVPKRFRCICPWCTTHESLHLKGKWLVGLDNSAMVLACPWSSHRRPDIIVLHSIDSLQCPWNGLTGHDEAVSGGMGSPSKALKETQGSFTTYKVSQFGHRERSAQGGRGDTMSV